MIFSIVAAIIISISAASTSALVGLTINLPSTLATCASDTGPWKGMSETASAADAANPAKPSGVLAFSSYEINCNIT